MRLHRPLSVRLLGKPLAACALLLASLSPASAQEGSAVPVVLDSLARVRIELTTREPRWLTGSLLAADAEALTLEKGGRLHVVPVSSVKRLDVSVERLYRRERIRSGAKRGLLIGAVTSGGLLLLAATIDLTTECVDCMLPASAVALGASVPLTASFTATGALLGALSGLDRWMRVPLPVQVQPASAPQGH